MATETILYQNDIVANSNDFTATTKKPQESDCHRQKQKKKNKASDEESDDLVEQIEIEYVLEKAELVKGMDEEFRKIFDKFTFTDAIALEFMAAARLSGHELSDLCLGKPPLRSLSVRDTIADNLSLSLF
ncbi:hypothetical protein JHK84_047753 [Glycine max]|nr:hypothetical protein JHK86_047735 [Glycine max]KAG4943705.1 hypothetical protein JHK85_048351 [Glycine max]KAG5102784.1 hypothetical protein JHK84_047753 [Glycine max]